MIEHPYR